MVREIVPSTSTLFFNEVPRTGSRKATLTLASGNGQAVKVTRVDVPGAPFLATSIRQNGLDAVIDVAFDGKAVPLGRTNGVGNHDGPDHEFPDALCAHQHPSGI